MSSARFCIALLLGGISGLLSGQVSAPRVGLVRYASGAVYPVYGVQGNYIAGQRLLDRADALSFSEAGGILSRQGMLLLLDQNLNTIGSYDGASTTPVVGIDGSLDTAIAWLPSRHTLVHWNGSALAAVAVPEGTVNGEVFSVRKAGTNTSFLLVKSSEGTVEEDSISLITGALVARTLVPDASGNLYRQGMLAVSVQKGQITMQSTTSGTRKNIPIRADDVSFERVSSTCVHLHAASSGRDWLLHFSGDQSWLFELPVPLAEVTTAQVAP